MEKNRTEDVMTRRLCKHMKNVGAMAVYVLPSCPRALMIKGTLVSTRKKCEECQSYEEK